MNPEALFTKHRYKALPSDLKNSVLLPAKKEWKKHRLLKRLQYTAQWTCLLLVATIGITSVDLSKLMHSNLDTYGHNLEHSSKLSLDLSSSLYENFSPNMIPDNFLLFTNTLDDTSTLEHFFKLDFQNTLSSTIDHNDLTQPFQLALNPTLEFL